MYENEHKRVKEEEKKYSGISKPRSVIGRFAIPIHIRSCISIQIYCFSSKPHVNTCNLSYSIYWVVLVMCFSVIKSGVQMCGLDRKCFE